jgi:pimeloyl-ACP methyl ester carboxylesterase
MREWLARYTLPHDRGHYHHLRKACSIDHGASSAGGHRRIDMAFATNGEVQVYYETFGRPDDPALLLVSGLGSQCINFRVEMCELFAARGVFVIRYDNRDVGLSSKFDHVSFDARDAMRALAAGEALDVPYRLSDMARDGIAVLDHLGIERAHVAGVSMGGMIVQTMAIEHPDRLLSMTSIMSTTGDPDVGQPSADARRLLLTRTPGDLEGHVAHRLATARVWGSPAHFDAPRLTANATEEFDRSCEPAGVTRQYFACLASGSRTAALRDVTVPTLVIHGDADALIDQSGGRRTAHAVPGARFELIEGMGHDLPPGLWDRLVGLLTEHFEVSAR